MIENYAHLLDKPRELASFLYGQDKRLLRDSQHCQETGMGYT